jgi:hypothetical protein
VTAVPRSESGNQGAFSTFNRYTSNCLFMMSLSVQNQETRGCGEWRREDLDPGMRRGVNKDKLLGEVTHGAMGWA